MPAPLLTRRNGASTRNGAGTSRIRRRRSARARDAAQSCIYLSTASARQGAGTRSPRRFEHRSVCRPFRPSSPFTGTGDALRESRDAFGVTLRPSSPRPSSSFTRIPSALAGLPFKVSLPCCLSADPCPLPPPPPTPPTPPPPGGSECPRTGAVCCRTPRPRGLPVQAAAACRGRSLAGATTWGPCGHPLPRSPVVAGPGAVAARGPHARQPVLVRTQSARFGLDAKSMMCRRRIGGPCRVPFCGPRADGASEPGGGDMQQGLGCPSESDGRCHAASRFTQTKALTAQASL